MDGVYIKAGLKEGEAVVLVVMPTLSGGSGVSHEYSTRCVDAQRFSA